VHVFLALTLSFFIIFITLFIFLLFGLENKERIRK
jgi:hypothetical protein